VAAERDTDVRIVTVEAGGKYREERFRQQAGRAPAGHPGLLNIGPDVG